MVKTVIIDNDKDAIYILKSLINNNFTEFEVVGEYDDPEIAKKQIPVIKPELLLLDIKLKEITALDLLQKLEYKDFKVIFITAYNQYASEAFQCNAIDYILKPVSIEKLGKALNNFKNISNNHSKSENHYLPFQKNILIENNKKPKIVLKTTQKEHIVSINEIIRCEADKNYTNFFLVDSTKIVISKNIDKFEKLLEDHDFIRPHKSHLVNIAYIRTLNKVNGRTLIMLDKTIVPVSTRKKEYIVKKFDEMFLHC